MFDGAKLKIKRANRHIDDLHSRLDEYFAPRDSHRLRIQDDGKGASVVSFEMTREVPEEIPLVIGDAVHNLHSALDILFCELVRRSGDVPDRYTKFPFGNSRDNLIGTLNGGKLKAAPAGVIDHIVNAVKPYDGGNDVLCGLHDADIQDKHLLLTPTVTLAGLRGVQIDDGGFNTAVFQFVQLGGGPEFRPIGKFVSPVHIATYRGASFEIVFGEPNALQGQPVIPTLHHLSQMILGTVESLETFFTS